MPTERAVNPRMPRVHWAESVPREVRQTFAPYVDRYLALLPAWLYDLSVDWDDGDTDSTASMTSKVEYRRGTVTVSPAWLSEDAARREQVARHEFSHFVLEPVDAFVRTLLDQLKDDEALQAWVKESWRQTLEGAVTDLTDVLGRWCDDASQEGA